MTTKPATAAKPAQPKRVYLFGTGIISCAGCYGPPHVLHGRDYLYRYALQGVAGGEGAWSPPVCCRNCIAIAQARMARPSAPLPEPAQRLLDKARADHAAEIHVAATASFEQRMARIRAGGDDAVAEAMAEFIIARAAGQESCTRYHLISAGFLEEEVTRLGTAAITRAAAFAPDLRG